MGDDGHMISVFGSALETDFRGAHGNAIAYSVESFRALKGAA
jgi:hypothetical protein